MNRSMKFLCLAALSLLAVGGTPAMAAANDTLVVAQGADAKTLDPHATNDQPSSRVGAQIYNKLVDQDENMNIIPSLAESWEQVDPVTTVFHLRKGVKFHNGEPLKASDVKFTLDRMKQSPSVQHIIGTVESVEVIDDNTVQIKTKQPFGALLSHLAHTAASILNEKAVTEAGGAYGQHPVGTGPYKFVNWQSGDRIILEANPDYYAGEAPTKNVIFRSVPEGTNRTIGLETGEIDIAYDIEPIDKEMVKNHKKLNLIEQPSLSTTYIGFNAKKDGPLANVKVRQAIAYTLDVNPIIEAVYNGAAERANSPIGPKVFGYNPDAKSYDMDIAKAKELLKEAGYPNGFKIKIWTNDNPVRRDIATIAQDQLRAAGIDATIELLEWGAYLDGTSRGEHDMFLLGWVSVTGDADYGLYPLFHSTQHGGAGNRSFYSNPEVDKLLEAGRVASSADERKDLYFKAQEIIQEEVPIYTLVYGTQNVGTQKNVEGFSMHPAGHHRIYGAKKVN